MVAISPHLTATLPFLPTLRPRPRRLPQDAFAASVSAHRTAGVALHGCRHCNPLARRLHGFENTISFWTRTEHNKQALFASGRDDNSSSPDGPPVLTILAGVIVFLLVLWVIGSIVTWIVGLVFGAAKS
ncbi:hypothetical protein SETIT_9G556200v2 [Setaria italica]|uniref:Uncharacterized protein n=1 Tax=Setaria italica TaxID=4555 RepID=K4AGM0_SETIT|nr:uncharacterized protein LOC101758661 [Setaria italica]RCV46750.1 hypothetical protein SETIT_9G556200v2 [Setaria italica]